MRINEVKNLVVKVEREVQGIENNLSNAAQIIQALRVECGAISEEAVKLFELLEFKIETSKLAAHELAN